MHGQETRRGRRNKSRDDGTLPNLQAGKAIFPLSKESMVSTWRVSGFLLSQQTLQHLISKKTLGAAWAPECSSCFLTHIAKTNTTICHGIGLRGGVSTSLSQRCVPPRTGFCYATSIWTQHIWCILSVEIISGTSKASATHLSMP